MYVGVDVHQTLDHLRRRKSTEDERIRVRAQRLCAAVPSAASHLREVYGAVEVTLFGSLATGRHLHAESDVDVAVRGLSLESLVAAHLDLEQLLRADVDLVALESAPPSLVERIRCEGVSL